MSIEASDRRICIRSHWKDSAKLQEKTGHARAVIRGNSSYHSLQNYEGDALVRSGMPYTFEFDLTNGILRCRLHGLVTDETLKDFFRTGADYAVRARPVAGVVDLSEVTSFDSLLPTRSSRLPTRRRYCPIQTSAELSSPPSPETYGMMRMFEIQGEKKCPNLNLVRTEIGGMDDSECAEPAIRSSRNEVAQYRKAKAGPAPARSISAASSSNQLI